MNKIKQLAEEYRNEIYENLSDLVNINSFTSNNRGLRQVSEKLSQIGNFHGIKFQELCVDSDPCSRPHLLYENPCMKEFYAFVGHFDTVHPPDSSFNCLVEAGENLVGPGVLDMKNGLLIAIYTIVILKKLIPLDKIPVKILFNSDEEIGSPASRNLIKSELQSAIGGFIFEPGKTGNHIVTQRKGILSLDIEVFGKPSHSGESPEKGINAIVRAADLIKKLNSLNDFDRGVSIQCNEISGGSARNVIPDHCQIGVDIRIQDMLQKEQITQKIKKILADGPRFQARVSYDLRLKRPPLLKNAQAKVLIDHYLKISEKLGFPAKETSTGGVSDANILSNFGVPCIDGLGSIGANPHTKKEYIIKHSLIDRLVVFSTFFLKLLKDKEEIKT